MSGAQVSDPPVIDTTSLAPGWAPLVERFLESVDGRRLREFLAMRRAGGARVYPSRPLRALELTSFDEVRVVIVGQDPYHGEGQAHGLAFSVPSGIRPPPSLRNILAEVARDLGCKPLANGALESWAAQGVLLVNAVLTVEEGEPGSHARRGWETLTSSLIGALCADQRPKVFMLWGAFAQSLGRDVRTPHRALTANHPSPLSARRPPEPFIGCGHFSKANAFLREKGRSAVDWCANAG